MTEWRTSPCRGCGEPMVWTVTASGKKMPVDPEEISRREAGDRALLFELQEGDDRRTPLAVVTRAEIGHQSHWATCPARDQFRGRA